MMLILSKINFSTFDGYDNNSDNIELMSHFMIFISTKCRLVNISILTHTFVLTLFISFSPSLSPHFVFLHLSISLSLSFFQTHSGIFTTIFLYIHFVPLCVSYPKLRIATNCIIRRRQQHLHVLKSPVNLNIK